MEWDHVLLSKWQPPGELMPMSTPCYFCHQCPCPHSEPQPPPATSGDTPKAASRSGSGFYEVTTFSLGPSAHETLCVPSKFGHSISPSLVEFQQSSHAGHQFQMLWDSSFRWQTCSLGSLTWGLELSHLWENICDIIIFQFVGSPPGLYGI